jgi:Tat protein translocase TatB subunit
VGSIGPAEIFVVLIVALIVLGPNRLPDAARSVGKAMAELRRMTSGVQAEVRDAFAEPPTYPSQAPVNSGGSTSNPPSSPEQADITVVREPDPPPSA